MGIHKMSSNSKNSRNKKRAKKAGKPCKKAGQGLLSSKKIIGEIPDIDIAPESVITQRRKNSRTNVELSGKKKRKIMKQLKRLQGGKKGKDVEMEDDVVASEASTSKQKKKKQPKVKDVTMDDAKDIKDTEKQEDSDEDMDV